jgi:hypothetical protein
MGLGIPRNVLGAAAAMSLAVPAMGGNSVSMGDDLKATVVLHGFACDQIASKKRNGDSDYLVACKDGNRYHVFVDPRGRVMVEKQ